jgi:hypothetical protein
MKRTYEELKSVKISDMTGEEYELFQNKGKVKDTTPSVVNNFFYAGKAALRSIGEKAVEIGDHIQERAEHERALTEMNNAAQKQINDMIDKAKKAMLKK